MEIISTFEMARSNPAHIGSSPISSLSSVSSTTSVSNVAKQTQVKPVEKSFNSYLIDAMSYVNEKQNAQTDVAQKLIVDPDSVDVHDVTIAMAEANLSLNLAQNVIDRMIKGWNEISTTR